VPEGKERLDEGEEVHYYDHRGKPLRSPPFKQARRAFEREEKRAKAVRTESVPK
jgi:hypothetical protein